MPWTSRASSCWQTPWRTSSGTRTSRCTTSTILSQRRENAKPRARALRAHSVERRRRERRWQLRASATAKMSPGPARCADPRTRPWRWPAASRSWIARTRSSNTWRRMGTVTLTAFCPSPTSRRSSSSSRPELAFIDGPGARMKPMLLLLRLRLRLLQLQLQLQLPAPGAHHPIRRSRQSSRQTPLMSSKRRSRRKSAPRARRQLHARARAELQCQLPQLQEPSATRREAPLQERWRQQTA